MATRETDGARWERLPPSFRASRGFAARARVCTPPTKPEEKERLLAVYGSPDGLNVLVGVDIPLFLNSLDIFAESILVLPCLLQL